MIFRVGVRSRRIDKTAAWDGKNREERNVFTENTFCKSRPNISQTFLTKAAACSKADEKELLSCIPSSTSFFFKKKI